MSLRCASGTAWQPAIDLTDERRLANENACSQALATYWALLG
jgi:hypothetical protein